MVGFRVRVRVRVRVCLIGVGPSINVLVSLCGVLCNNVHLQQAKVKVSDDACCQV